MFGFIRMEIVTKQFEAARRGVIRRSRLVDDLSSPDEELVEEIRTVLKVSPFLGEGYRKVKARLPARGIQVGKNRVLRLMREHRLLAPVRRGHPRGDRTHSGPIASSVGQGGAM